MKLTDLNPKFVGAGGDGITDSAGNPVPKRSGVGIGFDCPCGSSECLRVYIGFTNPLDGQGPYTQSPRWDRTGDTFETLTLSPSIQRLDNCKWHGYLRNGVFERC